MGSPAGDIVEGEHPWALTANPPPANDAPQQRLEVNRAKPTKEGKALRVKGNTP